MAGREPLGELAGRFSSPGASPTPSEQARGRLSKAQVFWLWTVRLDGRPHVTPLLTVWRDDAIPIGAVEGGPDSLYPWGAAIYGNNTMIRWLLRVKAT
jgi:hypothetical protein